MRPIVMRLDDAVHIWIGADALAFMDAEDAAFGVEGVAPTPVTPTLSLSDEDANALVVALLRGPQGPPGPMGPMGASAA